MITHKEYEFNPDIPTEDILNAGFIARGNNFKYRTTLYPYDNTNVPYVELIIVIENCSNLLISVVCNGDNHDLYIPFINPEMRHDNLVYDKVITNYNNVMDKLCKKKILKHVRSKKHGKD